MIKSELVPFAFLVAFLCPNKRNYIASFFSLKFKVVLVAGTHDFARVV